MEILRIVEGVEFGVVYVSACAIVALFIQYISVSARMIGDMDALTHHVVCYYIDHEIHIAFMQSRSESLEIVCSSVVRVESIARVCKHAGLKGCLFCFAIPTCPAASIRDRHSHTQYLRSIGQSRE